MPIDADALEKKLQEQRELYVEIGMKGAEHLLVHDFLRYVWEAPTIDPVRHGRWIEHKDYPGIAWLCSECGYFTTMRQHRYCPNCGAKMEEEERG